MLSEVASVCDQAFAQGLTPEQVYEGLRESKISPLVRPFFGMWLPKRLN